VHKNPSTTNLPSKKKSGDEPTKFTWSEGSQAGSQLDDWLRAEAEILRAQEAAIDEASEESFPASDAPAY
jgi:hypothetical protein